MDRLRILLVDDHDLFRKGIARLIDSQPDFRIVGEARDGREALEMARKLSPDVVLMDIEMPLWNGAEATRRIKAEMPDIDVVMLTVSDDDINLFSSIRAGASGYLLKSVKPEELFKRLRGVSLGEAAISPLLAAKILQEFARLDQTPTSPRSVEGLSPRETEVLTLVAKGMTNREIGEHLHIAENTVKNHLRNILEKLQLNNRAQAAAYAVRHGLV
ncbi:MAG: response regulator transcription factor [Anaerolineales bacterium]|nr:response regulator transcription factor [Anaerolineales bacterium]